MKKVLLLLANGFEFYEASAFIDVIGWNFLEGDKSTKLLICGVSSEVRSAFDHKIIADLTIQEIDYNDFDALAIPGGFEDYGFYLEAYSSAFSDVIRNFYNQKKTIASICTGALPVGNSGILKGRKATTYNMNPVRQNALADFGAVVVQEPVVIDDNIITSWNPSTALEVAFKLLENLTSITNANSVKKLMGLSSG